MDTRARVLEVQDGRAMLACDEPATCAACTPGRGCGMRWLGGDSRRPLVLPIDRVSRPAFSSGDTVTLTFADGDLLGSAARLYLPLLAGLLVGPVLARYLLQSGDGLVALGAVVGLLVGWLTARAWVRATPPRVTLSRCDESGPAA